MTDIMLREEAKVEEATIAADIVEDYTSTLEHMKIRDKQTRIAK